MPTKKIVTPARIAYFKSLQPKKLTPKQASALLVEIMMAHQTFFDVLWMRVAKRDKGAAAKLGALAKLTMKTGKFPACKYSLIPPGI